MQNHSQFFEIFRNLAKLPEMSSQQRRDQLQISLLTFSELKRIK